MPTPCKVIRNLWGPGGDRKSQGVFKGKLEAELEFLKGWGLKPKYNKIAFRGIKKSLKICKMLEKALKI